MKKENETFELKKSLSLLKEGVISLSSMLNKKNCGEVIFGVTDDLRVVGVSIGKKTLSDISHEIRNNLKPLPPVVDINIETIDNKDVIRIYVEGTDTPYSAYNRYYIRIDDFDVVMDTSLLKSYVEKIENNYSKWEEKVTDYGVDDIDEELLINCVRKANEIGRINYIYRNASEALEKFDLLSTDGKLKMAGFYLFGRHKPLKIKEACYPTDNRTEFGEIKEFSGNIFECINECMNYIQNKINYKADIIGITRQEIPEIPIKAIREIVNNAFAHCKYSVKEDNINITLFKSKIKVYNPGPLYQNIDPIKFASGEVGSKIRNLLIASVLYKCGLIDSFGTGFDRTFRLCNQNNIKYEYTNDEFGFTFYFIRNPNYLNDKINELEKEIIKLISENNNITIPELSERISKSEPTIYRHIEKLVSLEKLERIGSRKNGYWNVKI